MWAPRSLLALNNGLGEHSLARAFGRFMENRLKKIESVEKFFAVGKELNVKFVFLEVFPKRL